MKSYVSAKELQDYLKISESTLFRFLKQGMPVLKVGKKINRFCLEDVVEWLEKNQEKGE